MGLFDFFKTEKEDGAPKRPLRTEPLPRPEDKGGDGARPMQIRKPRSFEDIEEIIDRMKDRLTVSVYVNELTQATALRVTDI